jgi:hypothetical protein
MSQGFEKLKTPLQEPSQLGRPDLDFGLNRVKHASSPRDVRKAVDAFTNAYRNDAYPIPMDKGLSCIQDN